MHNAVSNVKAQSKVTRPPEVTPEARPEARPAQEPAYTPAEVYQRGKPKKNASALTSSQKPILPSRDELQKIYKKNCTLSLSRHTLFAKGKEAAQIIEELKTRAKNKPNKASDKTLTHFRLST